jgi:two-component system chemotaxis response regulator CheB
MRKSSTVLVVDDEPEIAELLALAITRLGPRVERQSTAEAAEKALRESRFDFVFCDVHLPARSGISMFESLKASGVPLPPFVFMTGNVDPAIIERASRIGASDVLLKPFDFADIARALSRAESIRDDALVDVMQTVQAITGIVLGPEKRLLVETRLARRARQLALPDLSAYLAYFRAHRDSEVHHLISLISTHTTEFFREAQHFDHLLDVHLPALLPCGKPIRMWSAASSTGEEVYSLAIVAQELARTLPSPEVMPPVEILGTDIDFSSIESASNGVYSVSALRQVAPELARRYFETGTGDLAGLVRVSDEVHRLCAFRQMNLLDFKAYPAGSFDAIFLRNVLIYFAPADVKRIAEAMAERLSPEGKLFVGHSESLSNLSTPLELVGGAIYRRKTAAARIRSSQSEKLRVLIVDDSATIRQLLRRILTATPEIEIAGEAENTAQAEKLIAEARADVMTLDIHMPGMDGISWLGTLKGRPRPAVVMVSSVSYEDAAGAMRCFELGAFDYIEKPAGGAFEAIGERLREVVVAAARNGKPESETRRQASLGRTARAPSSAGVTPRSSLLLLGASTGGIQALEAVLEKLPADVPPVLIVQHIPAQFSSAFAARLAKRCAIRVKEAESGDRVEWGHAYIAPGGRHMEVMARGEDLVLTLSDAPPVNRHRPSVDQLFASAAKLASQRPIAAGLLTGMGDDGARGLLALRQAGAHTVAQDEETCVVYGMPRVAAELGAAAEIVPLPSVGYHLLKGLGRRQA